MTSLKKYRSGYGYRQDKLAEKAHISPGYLCDLEHGIKKPSLGLARIIADIFGAKVEAVFPDGLAVKDCRQKFVPKPTYMPDPPPPARLYPRGDFSVICWHCKSIATLRADDVHAPADYDPGCPACGAALRDIMPLGEMVQP